MQKQKIALECPSLERHQKGIVVVTTVPHDSSIDPEQPKRERMDIAEDGKPSGTKKRMESEWVVETKNSDQLDAPTRPRNWKDQVVQISKS